MSHGGNRAARSPRKPISNATLALLVGLIAAVVFGVTLIGFRPV